MGAIKFADLMPPLATTTLAPSVRAGVGWSAPFASEILHARRVKAALGEDDMEALTMPVLCLQPLQTIIRISIWILLTTTTASRQA